MLQRHWGGGFYSIQLETLSLQETTGNKKTHHTDTKKSKNSPQRHRGHREEKIAKQKFKIRIL
jgi:hypothetical protein